MRASRLARSGPRFGTALLLAAATLAGSAAAARAEPGLVTWTTYLYEGPGRHYQVNDEVEQMTALDVLGCADGWCHVAFEGRTGYLMAEVVVTRGQDPAAPPPGKLGQPAASLTPTPRGPCFESNQKGGNGGNELTRFCEK